MKSSVYWLDANVFIQAKNGPYSFKLVPQFWAFISEQLENGTVRCPKIVYDELIKGGDDLVAWLKPRKQNGLYHHPSESVQSRYGVVADYVTTNFKPHQYGDFLKGADGWLIAHAMDDGGFVVTQENSRSYRSKIKIPTLCGHFDVRCINTYKMLSFLKADFS
jgi:hypothetical protein